MTELDGPLRQIVDIRLPRWGRVAPAEGVAPWLVVDGHGQPVEPVAQFLRDFIARGNSPASVRSYANALLRWWRWLRVVEVAWDQATSDEVRDFVLWLAQVSKPRRSPRTVSRDIAGTVNHATGKRHLDDTYEPRTVRHSNAVLRSFYEFWIDRGGGPLVNPMPRNRGPDGRVPNAHHNPLEPFRAEGRLRYNPKLPKQRPREMPEERWAELFGTLRSNRDRALLALAVSNGARAAELLGMRAVDVDWGEQQIRVVRKGTRAIQWLPASPDAFVWLRLYLADLTVPLEPNDWLWWTLRRRDHGQGLVRHPVSYEAARAVFRRVNAVLGTNWTMHDLRHTAALRMSRDDRLSLRDIQHILGHAHLATTENYLVEDENQVLRRVGQSLADRKQRPVPEPPELAAGYDAHDLTVLFGDTLA